MSVILYNRIPEGTVRKRYLTNEVTANFINLLRDTPADILSASCDFIVDSFNSKMRSIFHTAAPLTLKKTTTNPTLPWRNEKN